jgi:transcriptional regulator with PAS, ATPase and Fis domain
MLSKHEWPGNIRQLENCISRFIILGSEESLFNEMAARKTRVALNGKISEDGSIPLKRIAKQAVREMERNVIFQALQANHWNRKKTAQALKISYRSLLSKIQGAGGAA